MSSTYLNNLEQFEEAETTVVLLVKKCLSNGKYRVEGRAYDRAKLKVGDNGETESKNLPLTEKIFVKKQTIEREGAKKRFERVATLEDLRNLPTTQPHHYDEGEYRQRKFKHNVKTEAEADELVKEVVADVENLVNEYREIKTDDEETVVVA